MIERKIRVTFKGRANGGTVAEAIGFSGKGCLKSLGDLLQGMRATADSVQYKPEFQDQLPAVKEVELE